MFLAKEAREAQIAERKAEKAAQQKAAKQAQRQRLRQEAQLTARIEAELEAEKLQLKRARQQKRWAAGLCCLFACSLVAFSWLCQQQKELKLWQSRQQY